MKRDDYDPMLTNASVEEVARQLECDVTQPPRVRWLAEKCLGLLHCEEECEAQTEALYALEEKYDTVAKAYEKLRDRVAELTEELTEEFPTTAEELGNG